MGLCSDARQTERHLPKAALMNALAKAGIELGENGSIFPRPKGKDYRAVRTTVQNGSPSETPGVAKIKVGVIVARRLATAPDSALRCACERCQYSI